MFFAARPCPGIVHAGDILLTDVAAHGVQIFKFELARRDLHSMDRGPARVSHWHSAFAILNFRHGSYSQHITLPTLYRVKPDR